MGEVNRGAVTDGCTQSDFNPERSASLLRPVDAALRDLVVGVRGEHLAPRLAVLDRNGADRLFGALERTRCVEARAGLALFAGAAALRFVEPTLADVSLGHRTEERP